MYRIKILVLDLVFLFTLPDILIN